ncbi:MAG: hypothetical protein ACYC6G_05450 [Desulfobaccales bacterium]
MGLPLQKLAGIRGFDPADRLRAAVGLYRESEARGRVAFYRQLAVESLQLMDTQNDLALLLSVKALEVADTPEAKGSLLAGLMHQKKATTKIP